MCLVIGRGVALSSRASVRYCCARAESTARWAGLVRWWWGDRSIPIRLTVDTRLTRIGSAAEARGVGAPSFPRGNAGGKDRNDLPEHEGPIFADICAGRVRTVSVYRMEDSLADSARHTHSDVTCQATMLRDRRAQ